MNRALRTIFGLLMLLAGSFSGCDCRTHQVETDCWLHTGRAAGTACVSSQDSEPNDTLPTSGRAEITCANSTLQGTLAPNDIDVFHGAGENCEDSVPTASWQAESGRLCLFAGCEHGLMSFTGCRGGGKQMHYREGILGCCLDGPGTVALDVSCSALEKRRHLWVVADRHDGESCQSYEIKLHN